MSGGGNQADQQAQSAAPERNQQNPCEYEMKEFLQCAQNQSDITLCQGFNEALKQCKQYYNATGGITFFYIFCELRVIYNKSSARKGVYVSISYFTLLSNTKVKKSIYIL